MVSKDWVGDVERWWTMKNTGAAEGRRERGHRSEIRSLLYPPNVFFDLNRHDQKRI